MPSLSSDSKFKDYCARIRFLLATAVVPFSALMCSCVCQRNILELDAYITWILYMKPTWGKAHSWQKSKMCSVVGGIMDQPDVTEHCFWAGIPVWRVRRVPVTPDVQVMTWHLEPKPLPTMRSVMEKFMSFEDKSPPHPIIWEGYLKSLEYYIAMSKNNRSIAFPASIFDNPQSDPPSAATSAQPETAVTSGSSNITGFHFMFLETPKGTLYVEHPIFVFLFYSPIGNINPVPAPQTASSLRGRNKFEPSVSLLMPPLVVNWVKASRDIGSNFDSNQQPLQGDWRSWDRINELQSLTSTSRGRVATPTVDLTKLKDIVPMWKGVEYLDTIPDETYTSILNNLTITSNPIETEDGEVNGEVDDLAPSENCMRRLGGIEGFSTVRMGFGSSELMQRQAASYNLYRIMQGWCPPYAVIPLDVETATVWWLAPSRQPSVTEVDRTEYLVAHCYICVFSDFFNHPPPDASFYHLMCYLSCHVHILDLS
ncbi:hypothetical protein BDP27DRAFT_1437468 [Rhodocollybia butyracea]|uniref:Uncharacterized protein n=1 Tax=Rhodocollybia butyracea TaxID=206335 RepID=A0A9P5P0P7_9AGAR|nr:hypothetical protein BDP27DRAFT_1437468 [Rhodocollybia butyracea]